MTDVVFSSNERAEQIMGRRPTNVVPIDLPCEMGYRCPVCLVPAIVGGDFDQRLTWSEYEGFLWCEVCNVDYPSAFCVPLDGEAERDAERPWVKVGMAAAIGIFLDTVAMAAERSKGSA